MNLSFVMVLGILFIERTFNDNVDVFKIFRFIRSIHFFLGKTSPTPHLLAGWFSRPRTPGQSCSITIMSLRWCRCPFTSRAASQICNGIKKKPCRLSGRTTVAWTGCIDTKVLHNQLRFNFEQSKMILPWGQENCGKRQRSANLWKRKSSCYESQTIKKKTDLRLKDLLIQQVKYYKAIMYKNYRFLDWVAIYWWQWGVISWGACLHHT